MKVLYASSDTLSKIGTILGRDVFPERGQVASFGDFTDADMREFKTLGTHSHLLAIAFIDFKLAEAARLPSLKSFYGGVVQQGISMAEWAASGDTDAA